MKPRDLICFLAGILIVLAIFSFGHRFRETEQPEPIEPEYTVSEPMLADLERLSPYRNTPTILHVPAPEETPPVRYELTDAERQLVCEVVMAESGNQSYLGNAMVAFCILNACEKDDLRPAEVIREYQYTSNRVSPSQAVCEAVAAVFDRGEEPVMDKPLWFYAYKQTKSNWHESQRPICIVGDHAFFGEKE